MKRLKRPYHPLFSSRLCCVEDLVASYVAHRWVPSDGQGADARVDHLQVLHSTQRSWEGGGAGEKLNDNVFGAINKKSDSVK